MTSAERSRLARLEREVRFQRSIIRKLARALHTHTRTDLAPDAALPLMRRIVELADRKT